MTRVTAALEPLSQTVAVVGGYAESEADLTESTLRIACLFGALLLISAPDPSAAGSKRHSGHDRDPATTQIAHSHLRVTRHHHRGRSFLNRRFVFRRDPHLRHHVRKTQKHQPTCRPVSKIGIHDGRRALIGGRLCTDGFGGSAIASGSRTIIEYLDD